MAHAVLVVLAIVVLIVTWMTLSWKKRKNLPPGPTGLPIIGYLHNICSAPIHIIMNELSHSYGDIFCVQLGSRLTVVLNSREAIYETFVKKAKLFAGRPDLATFNKTRHGYTGVSMCDFSERYKQNRQMTVKALHRLYFNKTKLNEIMEQEVNKMVALFDQHAVTNTLVNPREEFYKIVPSIVVNIMFGRDFRYDNKDLIALVNFNRRWFESSEANNPADFFKVLEKFPNERLNAIEESAKAFYAYTLNKIEEHDANNWGLLQSYLEYYRDILGITELCENEKLELARVIADTIGAGFDTVAVTLDWSLLLLANQPEVTVKCRQELQRQCGSNFLKVELQNECPYFAATIYEILRLASTAPMGLPRTTTDDVKIRDYDIPKGAMVFPNIWAVNRDSSCWNDIERINPSNFLTDEGLINADSVKKLATFSSGIRKCPGDKLAISEMFVMLGTIIKTFEFKMDDNHLDSKPSRGLTLQPKRYTIRISKLSMNNNTQ